MGPRSARAHARWLWLLLVAGCQQDCGGSRRDRDLGTDEDLYFPDGGARDGRAGDERDAEITRDGGTEGGVDAATDDAGGEPDAGEDAEVLCPGAPLVSIGSAAEPRTVRHASLPFEGEIDWRGMAFLEITGLTPSQRYVVTLVGPSDLTLRTYEDDPSFTTSTCFAYPQGEAPAACAATPAGSRVHVAIDAINSSARFELDVRPLPDNAAPNDASPVAFSATALPVEISAVPFEPSFYVITGLSVGERYVVSATDAAEDVVISVRTEPTSHFPDDERSGRSLEVVGTPTSTSLYISTTASVLGTAFELDIEASSFVSQGTAAAPVAIAAGDLPFAGEIDAWTVYRMFPGFTSMRSYYVVTGLSPGTQAVRLSAAPGIGIATFGETGDFLSPDCAAVVAEGGDAAFCSTSIEGTTLYLAAFNTGGEGSLLELELIEPTHTSEGTSVAPLARSIASGELTGEVAAGGVSYYRLTAISPGTPYVLRLSLPVDVPLSVDVYDSGGLDPLCQLSSHEASSECVLVPSGAQLDVHVAALPWLSEGIHAGTAFSLTAERVTERDEGSELSPLRLSCDGAYDGVVGTTGTSFYEFDGLTPGAAYVVELSEPSATYELAVSSANVWLGEPACAQGAANELDRCKRAASTSGDLFARVQAPPGTSFRLRVAGATSGSEGSATTPLAIVHTATPYVGRVAAASPSYYRLTGLVRSKLYTVQVATLQETVALNLFRAGFSDPGPKLNNLNTAPGEPGSIVFAAPGPVVDFTMSLLPEVDGITTFTLKVTPY